MASEVTPQGEQERESQVPPFQVEWGCPDAGWIDIVLVGESRYEISAGCYDPFPAMLDWIKRCNGEYQAQCFIWYDEAIEHRFTYHRYCQHLRVEPLDHDGMPKPELTWDGFVSLEDLNKAFYVDFWNHLEDSEFEELAWFQLTAREILARSKDLQRLEETLVGLGCREYGRFWTDYERLIGATKLRHFDGFLRGEEFRRELGKLCAFEGLSAGRYYPPVQTSHEVEDLETMSREARYAVVRKDLERIDGFWQISPSEYPRIPPLETLRMRSQEDVG